ncbi:MAG TPA: SpoIIE family protein phosphatase [Candidatus Acidoferrales bacterium]|nr:SpoIIE family protein phosphatase [Candidatus Acidoferrales bacterium]
MIYIVGWVSVVFAVFHLSMHFLFRTRDNGDSQSVEPVPTVFPTIDGADIAAVFVGKRMAGDFYDSIRVSPQRILIGLLDVAGRREDNRQILVAAQKMFRESGPELFAAQDVNEADAMTELSLRINRGLIDMAGVLSCPAFIACYHEEFGTLCYANDGHIPGLLRDATGISELTSTGLPLGLFSHATSDSRIVAMEKGAQLVVVSNGVISCEGNGSGSDGQFGLDRVKEVLQNAPSEGPQALCSSILSSAGKFSGHAPICDDRTALALIRTK